MYQYKAVLKKQDKVIAEGHSVEEVENQILHFKRQQKRNDHTHMNDQIEIFHTYRDEAQGKRKNKLVKVV